jgi:hypothetical protein
MTSGVAGEPMDGRPQCHPRRAYNLDGAVPQSGEGLRVALDPEAGEWLRQATSAILGRVPLEVLGDTIQPSPPSQRSTSPP